MATYKRPSISGYRPGRSLNRPQACSNSDKFIVYWRVWCGSGVRTCEREFDTKDQLLRHLDKIEARPGFVDYAGIYCPKGEQI